MRICVSGSNGQGKSTFINDFLNQWKTYTTPKETYRDLLIKDGLDHSKDTTQDTQWAILNNMIDTLQKYNSDDKVIFDRGPLDNLAYTLWKYSKGDTDIDDEFMNKCITLIRESMKSIDIIFFTPITKVSPIDYSDRDDDLDADYIQEIDNIFKAFKYDWDVNENTKIFDPRDKPAMIEIFGSPQERIQMVKLYLDDKGDLIGGEGGSPIISEEELKEQEYLKQRLGVADSTSEAYKNTMG
jgi:predicted ATPase